MNGDGANRLRYSWVVDCPALKVKNEGFHVLGTAMTEEKAREQREERILEVESLLRGRADSWTATLVDLDTGKELESFTREEWRER